MQADPLDLAASHQAMMKSLLMKPIYISSLRVWEIISAMGLSRDVSEPKHFGDGLLIAEIIHLHSSLLVPCQDLQKLELEARHFPHQRRIWNHLALTAFKQLCLQITNELVSSFERGEKSNMAKFLEALLQQLDQYQRIQKAFNSFTRTSFGEYFQHLTALRTFEGIPFQASPRLPWVQGKTVIRLSNVDYHTKKYDVQKFLYPIIVDQADIHIPVHLNSGKMMYTIFVIFDDANTPLRAIELHSGMSLLARRVEIRVVSMDELLIPFFSRGLETSSTYEVSEWVHKETKEKIFRLCRFQRQRGGMIPDRTFEHVISYLQLLPYSQNIVLSPLEVGRVFELAFVSLNTLIGYLTHDKQKGTLFVDLLRRLFKTCLSIPIFTEDQIFHLQSLYKEHQGLLSYTSGIFKKQSFSPKFRVFFPPSFNPSIQKNQKKLNRALFPTSLPSSWPTWSSFTNSTSDKSNSDSLPIPHHASTRTKTEVGLLHHDIDPIEVLGKTLWEVL